MHFYSGYHFWGMHLWWWAFWIVLLIVIFATPWLASGRRRRETENPLEILKKRYASGDLSTEEYEERKAVLEKEEGLET